MMDMLQMGCIGAIDLIGWSIRIELFYLSRHKSGWRVAQAQEWTQLHFQLNFTLKGY
jgi:hypothetical protein